MKFRSFIWISGFALIILGLVQYYFITETFQTKKEQFDSKYSSLAKLGLFEFENRFFDRMEDSIFNMLDDIAYFAIHDITFTLEETRDSLFTLVYKEFNHLLNENRTKNGFLKSYFKASGEHLEFNTFYKIIEISLLSFGNEILVQPNLASDNRQLPVSGYNLNSYTIERNFFRIKYEFQIDFPQRREQIAREMILTKILSFGTVLIVFFVFFLTLRNLLIQKRLSELKTDFINNMTHELKTPLSTISVASSSLSMKEGLISRERIVEISEVIKKQNKHLSSLIDRILDISIWEKDQIKIVKQPVQLLHFLNDIIKNFTSTNTDVSVSAKIVNIDEDTRFPIDELHMTTVLNNLLSNAVKYGGSPGAVDINADYGSSLRITIKDNGQGIPSEEQKQIFEKFFRGRNAKKYAIRGLGLGLYYVKQIINAHGGTISLEQSDSNGSLFIIEIP